MVLVVAAVVVADALVVVAQVVAVVVVMAPALALRRAQVANRILALRTRVQVTVTDLLTHDLHAQVTHVQPVLALLKQSLAVNARTLAVAKNASPASPPF